ncbi:hypothetical protein OEB96_08845 [Paraliomyxa miuraensis]|nr:hypothetical protein [Paraliomyxa miuraensis]
MRGVSMGALLAIIIACKAGGRSGSDAPGEGVTARIQQIAAGVGYTVILFDDGHVRMVGSPLPGEEDEGPRDVDFGGRVAEVAAGVGHMCARLRSGAVRCMGRNAWGALGNGSTDPVRTAEQASNVDVGGEVVELSAGHGHTCARLATGAVRCWGTAQGGRLGYGNREEVHVPAQAGDVPVGGSVRAIEAGPMGMTCAILDDGALRCWGQSTQGGLGLGSTRDVGVTDTPASVGDVPLPGLVVDVAVAGAHVCALLDTGKVRCWGFGAEGRLGYASDGRNVGDDETPFDAPDVDVGGPVVQLEAGGSHVCARLESGAVRCWGTGPQGQLGYGERVTTVGKTQTPAQAGDVPLGGRATRIAVSRTHGCALLESGEVKCWGRGFGGHPASSTPTHLELGTKSR